MRKNIVLLAIIIYLIPSTAFADAGLPMLALAFPAFILSLIPIIFIEAYVFKYNGFEFKWSLKWNAISNTFTTFVGIPITWFIFTVLETIEMLIRGDGCHIMETIPQKIYAVFLEAPWLCPYEKGLEWMIPTAFLILLIPFFFISWKIETWIISKWNKSFDYSTIRKLCLRANIITYSLLALYPLIIYIFILR